MLVYMDHASEIKLMYSVCMYELFGRRHITPQLHGLSAIAEPLVTRRLQISLRSPDLQKSSKLP